MERLRALIDDLLALNQVEAGAVQLEREQIDLRTVVNDAIAEMLALLREKGQTLEFDLPEPLPLCGDAHRLMRVVTNVLANAHQHTPPHTQILVIGWIMDGQVRLAVRDSGQESRPKSWRRSSSVFTGSARRIMGQGSGSRSRGIVELHGGRIWAESQHGKGTTFQTALPLTANAN